MYKRTPYGWAMAGAVQFKRLLTGTYGETRFTKFLEAIQYVSKDEHRSIQAERLCRVLNHVVSNIPYYRYLDHELELCEKTVFEDIRNFPVITKEIIKENRNQFIDKNCPFMYEMKTGGTSRLKLNILRDRYSATERIDEYFNRVMDIYPGRSRLSMSLIESDYKSDVSEYTDYYINRMTRHYVSRPLPLTEEKFKKTYGMLMKYNPEFLRGNPYALFSLAGYIEKNNLEKPKVDILMSYGMRLMPLYRETIERVFGSRVFDTYGATEINYVAAQCKEHRLMHYVPAVSYLECRNIISGEDCMDAPGSLIVTSTSHFAMPIIRYEIGDIATLTEEKCCCGRTLPSIEAVHGRTMEKLLTESGSLDVIDLDSIVSCYETIADYQAIQREKNILELDIVSYNGTAEDRICRKIEESIREKTGDSLKIRIKQVDRVEQEDSAKVIRLMPYEYYKKRIRKEANLC